MINRIIKNLPLLLLLSAVTLSLGFNMGTFGGGKNIEIRIEDILIVFLGLVFIFDLVFRKKGKINKPPLFSYIIVWLTIGLVSVLLNILLARLAIDRGVFYYLKQVEFFIFYFYVFYQIKDIKTAKFSVGALLFLGIINAFYVIYQGVTGNRMGEYGTAAICERGVFPTGSFFMLFSIISVNFFLHYYYYLKIGFFKKIILCLILLTPILGVFGSDSKTNFLVFVCALILTMGLLILKRRNLKLLFTIFFIFGFSVLAFLFVQKYVPFAYRLMHVLSYKGIESGFIHGRWIFILKVIKDAIKFPSMAFLGFGPGYVGEAHNQFLRNYMEVGILGSIAFVLLIFSIIKISLRAFLNSNDKFLTAISSSLLVCTVASVATALVTDTFIVVKPSEVYWIFAAIALAAISLMTFDNRDTTGNHQKGFLRAISPNKSNICAVVVSHSPDSDFINNLRITVNQVDKVVVVNNGSLRIDNNFFDKNGLSKNIFLINNAENLGQGRALNQGVEWCIKNNYKWVLVLDQDSKLAPDMVENQITAFGAYSRGDQLAAVGVNCSYKGTGEIKYMPKNVGDVYFERDVIMASGMLLSLDVFTNVGKFREDFFIDSTDADYCLKLRKNHYKIIVAYKAMMDQRVGEGAFIKRFLWKKILVTNHSPVRCYYMTRNGLILVREYLFLEPYWCVRRLVWYFLVKPFFIILYEDSKLAKIKMVFLGILHAIMGKKGKYIS